MRAAGSWNCPTVLVVSLFPRGGKMPKKLPLWGRREKRVGFFSLSPNWKVVWETEVAGRRKRERGRRNISPGSAKNAFSSFPSVSEAFFSQPLIFGVGKVEAEILITPDKLLPWNKILYLFRDPLWAFYLQQSAEKVVRYWLATLSRFVTQLCATTRCTSVVRIKCTPSFP